MGGVLIHLFLRCIYNIYSNMFDVSIYLFQLYVSCNLSTLYVYTINTIYTCSSDRVLSFKAIYLTGLSHVLPLIVIQDIVCCLVGSAACSWFDLGTGDLCSQLKHHCVCVAFHHYQLSAGMFDHV